MNPTLPHSPEPAESAGFAFLPIVDARSGTVCGFEAVLPDPEAAAFSALRLLDLAASKFLAVPARGSAKLFYPLDGRGAEGAALDSASCGEAVDRSGLDRAAVVFVLSGRRRSADFDEARRALESFAARGFGAALDDFGAGNADLRLLQSAPPGFVRLNRSFLDGIAADQRKRRFAERLVDLSHSVGALVVAGGVATERELQAYRSVGGDLVQGALISPQERDVGALRVRYPAVAEIPQGRRRGSESSELLRALAEPIPPARLGEDVLSILERFRAAASVGLAVSVIPVIDGEGLCVGVLRERDFRKYVYSPYGIALLRHESSDKPFGGLVAEVPVLDARAELRSVQDLFLGSSEADGVVLSDGGKYAGFLDARSILRAVSERELADAQDQNPLSRLPGNSRLEEYLAERWDDPAARCVLCYFDFNDFKPFNDHYGFRRGDRVILLFADILRSLASRSGGWFIAHIGGDDFFAGCDCSTDEDSRQAASALRAAADRFAADVEAFYDAADRERGWMDGHDRAGAPKRFPLLSVSAAIHLKRPGPAEVPLDQSGELFARLKRAAKDRSGQ